MWINFSPPIVVRGCPYAGDATTINYIRGVKYRMVLMEKPVPETTFPMCSGNGVSNIVPLARKGEEGFGSRLKVKS